MRVLVLGGYGFIGLEVVRQLAQRGYDVVGLGRSAAMGRRLAPDIAWIGADLATLVTPEAWRGRLTGVDAIVNASGVLQDGLGDDLARAQHKAIKALVAAASDGGVARFVQISAGGADPDADTAFMRTKAAADAALRASTLEWVVLKPGFVLGSNAYGGSSLVRTISAFPWAQPLMLGDRPIRIVAASDVAEAVVVCLEGGAPMRCDYDLVADESVTLADLIAKVRAWQGFPQARAQITVHDWLGFAMARLGDLAGWAGWRPPLRTTALRVLAGGIHGDPEPWRRATGRSLLSLDETLERLPAKLQERVFARAQLVFPLLVVTLSLFWIAAGVIGLLRREEAAAVLDGALSVSVANSLVVAGSALDMLIGVGVAVRSWTRPAALASAGLALVYLVLGSLLTPHLWTDPLGPLVKIAPAIALGLAVAALAVKR